MLLFYGGGAKHGSAIVMIFSKHAPIFRRATSYTTLLPPDPYTSNLRMTSYDGVGPSHSKGCSV